MEISEITQGGSVEQSTRENGRASGKYVYAVCFIGNGRQTALADENVISRHSKARNANIALRRYVHRIGALERNYAIIDTRQPLR